MHGNMHKVEVARGRGFNVAPDSERHGGDKGLSFAFPCMTGISEIRVNDVLQ